MMLTVSGLSKNYGDQSALHNINLRIANGMTALLGANGSGKSTLLRLLATAIQPDAGQLRFAGYTYTGDLRDLRRCIGYLPQTLDLPGTLSPFRLLQYLARLKGVHDRTQIDMLLTAFGLHELANNPLSQLSSGQQRLVGIAQALLGRPRLILLDELLRGLDLYEKNRVLRIVQLVVQQQAGTVVLFSSHIPVEVELAAQWVIVLDHGAVLFKGEVNDLIATATGCVYQRCVLASEAPAWTQRFTVSRIVQRGDHVMLRIVSPAHVVDADPVAATLEDAYLLLCRHGLR